MSTLEEKKQRLLNLKGAMPAVVTPYDQKGEVDVTQIPGYAKYMIDSNVDAIFICGTTGEGLNLNNEERLALAKAWRSALDKHNSNLLTAIQVSNNCVKDALQLSKQVEDLGIDVIVMLPPNYYKPNTVDDWVNYIKLFGTAAPNTPILYYHNVYRIGEFNFEFIDAIGECLKRVPQFTALKFSDTNAVRLHMLYKKYKNELKIMIGSDQMLLTGLTTIDCKAGCCLMFNFPEVVNSWKKMIAFVENNDLKSARKEQEFISDELIRIKANDNFFLAIKSAINANVKPLGLDFGVPRPPTYYQDDL